MKMEAAPITVQQLQRLFKDQQRFLNSFFDGLEYEPIEAFCKACLDCRGSILFTGIGKSGFIAQKVCQTLVSTGTKAVFLSPTDALHGDIGIVGQDDLVVIVSKSGATEELLRLVPYAKAKGAKLVSVTSVVGCRLAALCDMCVHLPLERELCPFDLAPVTSTAAQMVFGDTVAIALMQAKRLTQEEFAMNHPAGRIGKRLILRVHDVMLTGSALPLAAPDTLIMESLKELTGKGVGCLLVVDPASGQLLGTFTDGDLRRTLQGRGAQVTETRLREVMCPTPRTCTSTIKAVDAMLEMERPPRKVTFFPVVDEGRLVGLVTLHGLVSAGL
ncbi:g9996 [Coccomyxa elongata]